jgi:hypothetical protein
MRKLLLSIVFSLSLFLPFLMTVQPVIAQEEEETLIAPYEEYDWESYYDDLEDLQNDYTTGSLATGGLLLGGALTIVPRIISIVVSLGVYIYMAFALMTIAKRLNMENTWYAWVPILNAILLFKMGEQNPMLLFLLLIPGVGALIVGIISIIAIMNICEKRGYDKLLGLLMLVPIANFVLLGMLAWGKKEV